MVPDAFGRTVRTYRYLPNARREGSGARSWGVGEGFAPPSWNIFLPTTKGGFSEQKKFKKHYNEGRFTLVVECRARHCRNPFSRSRTLPKELTAPVNIRTSIPRTSVWREVYFRFTSTGPDGSERIFFRRRPIIGFLTLGRSGQVRFF